MRRVVFLLLDLILVGVCIVSPWGVSKFLGTREEFSSNISEVATANAKLASAKNELRSSKAAFEDTRTFDVSYKDLTRVSQLLHAVAGLTVTDVQAISIKNDFAVSGTWVSGEQVDGLQFKIQIDSTESFLRVLGKLQLPVYSVAFDGKEVTLTILSGEEKVSNG